MFFDLLVRVDVLIVVFIVAASIAFVVWANKS